MSKRIKRDRTGELVRALRESARAASDRRSILAVAKSADIEAASLGRFLKEQRSLTLDSADRLAAALGLRLTNR